MFQVLFYTIYLVYLVRGQTLTDTKQVYTDVFANLNTKVIPKSNPSVPLDVSVTFYPMTIASFQESEEVIVILCAIKMNWTDSGISWNPTTYGNMENIALSNDNIWTPSLSLLNSVETLEPLDDDAEFNANIYYDGTIDAVVGGVLRAKCKTDILKFPYDSQTCTLQFNQFNVLASDVTLTVNNNSAVETGFYTPNSDWDLKSYSAQAFILHGYSIYEVTFTIKRRPLYYSIMVVCPTLLFALVNPLVFLLPVESGERIGLAMTILLSYAIFLTVTSTAVPATSNPMSLTLLIMMVTIIFSGLIVVASICILALHHRDERKKINSFWRFLATRLPWNKNANTVKSISDNDNKLCPTDDTICWKDVTDSLDILCMITSFASLSLIAIIYWTLVLT